MYILINARYGDFNFSADFKAAYPQMSDWFGDYEYDFRTNKNLIRAVYEFGAEKAGGEFSELEFAWIPEDATDFMIQEYDGLESVYYVQNGCIYLADSFDSINPEILDI